MYSVGDSAYCEWCYSSESKVSVGVYAPSGNVDYESNMAESADSGCVRAAAYCDNAVSGASVV